MGTYIMAVQHGLHTALLLKNRFSFPKGRCTSWLTGSRMIHVHPALACLRCSPLNDPPSTGYMLY